MGLALSLKKAASKLVGKLGGDVTIRSVTVGAYDPSSGTASESVSDAVVKGFVENVNAREVNDLVKAGDRRLTVAAADLSSTPSTSDKVVITGVVYQIVNIETIEQDNQAITYEIVLRE